MLCRMACYLHFRTSSATLALWCQANSPICFVDVRSAARPSPESCSKASVRSCTLMYHSILHIVVWSPKYILYGQQSFAGHIYTLAWPRSTSCAERSNPMLLSAGCPHGIHRYVDYSKGRFWGFSPPHYTTCCIHVVKFGIEELTIHAKFHQNRFMGVGPQKHKFHEILEYTPHTGVSFVQFLRNFQYLWTCSSMPNWPFQFDRRVTIGLFWQANFGPNRRSGWAQESCG